MKSCPTCNRTYPDDTLAFCLMDGSVLSAPYDPDQSKREPARRVSGSTTEVLRASEPKSDPKIPLRSTMTSPVEMTRAGSSPAPATMRTPSPDRPPVAVLDPLFHLESKPAPVSWIFRTALVLRGLAAIFFCALFLAWPGLTFLVLGGILGAYAITSGVLEAIGGIDGWIKHKSGWLLTVDGVFSAVCGLAIFVIVGAHLYRLFFYWLALWPLGTGILQILTAVQLRKRLKYGWLLALAGPVSIVCGLLFGSVIFMGPVFNLLNFKWITNLYLIVPGIFIMAFGFAVRKKTAGSS